MENQNNRDEIEIDLLELLHILLGRWWLILGIGFLAAVIGLMISSFVLTPVYESTTKIYILNKNETASVTYSDVQMGTQLTKDYAELINSRYVLEEVIQKLALDESQRDDTYRYTHCVHHRDRHRPAAGPEYCELYQGSGGRTYPECDGYRGCQCS